VGISRIEQIEKNHFGYYVRLNREGIQFAKFFSDKKYGGKRKSLEAAKEYYTNLVEKVPLKRQYGRSNIRNTSGYVGVSRTRSTRRGHVYEYWQAWWGSGENRKSVKFSINKYGAGQAKQLAIKARRAWEKEAEAQRKYSSISQEQ
jgi:hypothetical protein